MTFLIWSPDGETVADAVHVEADFADEAAQADAERRCRIEAEWPERTTLHVQDPVGQIWSVEVRCEHEPVFYASRPVMVMVGVAP